MPDRRLVFDGINGCNIFDPKEILSDRYTLPIYITNSLINNQSVSPWDESGIRLLTIRNLFDLRSQLQVCYRVDFNNDNKMDEVNIVEKTTPTILVEFILKVRKDRG